MKRDHLQLVLDLDEADRARYRDLVGLVNGYLHAVEWVTDAAGVDLTDALVARDSALHALYVAVGRSDADSYVESTAPL